MKKNTLLLGLFLVICKLSFSTTQVRDVLYWNGTTYHVYPFIHVEKRFSEAQKTKLNERVKDHIATSNWRGYYFELVLLRPMVPYHDLRKRDDRGLQKRDSMLARGSQE